VVAGRGPPAGHEMVERRQIAFDPKAGFHSPPFHQLGVNPVRVMMRTGTRLTRWPLSATVMIS